MSRRNLTYVCQNCGYFEQYVQYVDELANLSTSTNWHRQEMPSS